MYITVCVILKILNYIFKITINFNIIFRGLLTVLCFFLFYKLKTILFSVNFEVFLIDYLIQ